MKTRTPTPIRDSNGLGVRSRLIAYALAIGVTLATLGLRLWLSELFGDRPVLVLFLLPIILSAYAGGLGPGLVATLVTALSVDYYVIQPQHSFAFERPADFAQWLILLIVGVLVSVLNESLHRSRRDGNTNGDEPVKSLAAERKVRAGFAFALACLGGIVIMSYFSLSRLREDAALLRRSDEVLGCLHTLMSTITDAETAQRGYAITGEKSYLEPYKDAEIAIGGELSTLRELTEGRSDARSFDELKPLIRERMDFLGHEIAVRRDEGFAAAQALTLTGEGKRLHDRIRAAVDVQIARELGLLRERESADGHASVVARGVIFGGGGLAFAVVAVSLFAITRDFAGSRRAEIALREARDRLEDRVRERTQELERRNDALAESERRYRGLAQLSPHAIFTIGHDSRVAFINKAGLKLFRTDSLEEVLGRSPLDFFHPDSREDVQRRMMLLFEKPRSMSLVEEKMILTDGTVIQAEVAAASFEDEGTLVIQVVCQDITERKQAELSVARLAAIVESSEDAVISKNLDGIITSWNHGAEVIFGYTAAEITGRPITTLIPPDLIEEESFIQSRLKRGENLPHFQTVRVKKDGTCIDVSVTISVIKDRDGRVVGASKVVRDITEQKNAERGVLHERNFSKAVVDSLPGVFYLYDRNGRFLRWNKNFETVSGYSAAEMAELHPIDFFNGADKERVASRIAEVFAKGESAIEASFVTKNGEEIPYYFTGKRISLDGEDCLVGVGIDISARRQAEAQVSELNADLERRVLERTSQLEAANKELEAFSYSVSHDLRAPLRTVDGFSQAVLEDYGPELPEDGRRYLHTIRRGAQQMGALIDDLLKFARLSRATMEFEQVDMNRLVQVALIDLRINPDDSRVDFRLGKLPPCLGDAALLRQVWVNLLSNAVKYSGRREKAVVETGSQTKEGATVYFVKDNGAGFDMRYADKLFGVFQRLHRAEDYEGTGVGLAIVQRIVHRHGGRIWAESEEDRGATFYFTLTSKEMP
ncbi:MAG TPA: PAS domain S-box protein [Rariglobus sp.]|nr:PAS domain S-box protein [Rariglobus sp.]